MNNKKLVSYWIIMFVVILITIIFLCLINYSFVFRLYDSVISFFKSFYYYFVYIFRIEENPVAPNTYYDIAITNPYNYSFPLPTSNSVFLSWFQGWFFILFNKDYFLSSTSFIYNLFSSLNIILMFAVSIVLLYFFGSSFYFSEQNPEKVGYTNGYKRFNKFEDKFIVPVISYFKDFKVFLSKHQIIIKLWILVLLFELNIISAILDVLSYYFIFSASFNFVYLWKLVYSTIYSLWPLFINIPLFIWIILIYVVFCYIRYKNAINFLSHKDYINRDFVSSLGVATFIKGAPGSGKTTLMTDFVLSCEQNNRYAFLDIINKYKAIFKNFDFNKFFIWIKNLKKKGVVFNDTQLEYFINLKKSIYIDCLNGKVSNLSVKNMLFQYDLSLFPEVIFDGSKNIDVFEMMIIVGKAYWYYIIEVPLVFSNYPIRFDSFLNNKDYLLPTWCFPYFNVSGLDFDLLSKICPIIDNNTMRFGKKLTSDHVAPTLGCFTVVMTECDKERGNQFDKVGMKKEDDFANLVNDYYNLTLKLSRHFSTIDFRPFFRFFSDSQRVGSVNSDFIETNENIVTISSNREKHLAIKCWFYEEIFLEFLIGVRRKFNINYDSTRNYTSCIYYLVNFILGFFELHYIRTMNKFLYEKCNLKVTDGNQENDRDVVYFLLYKKIYSNRFATDVYKKWFEKEALESRTLFEDYPVFKTLYVDEAELNYENSFMVRNVEKLKFDSFVGNSIGGSNYDQK